MNAKAFLSLAVFALFAAACGPDAAASLAPGAFVDDEAVSSDALTSSAVSDWWPVSSANTWTFANGTKTQTLRFADYAENIAYLTGLTEQGFYVGYNTRGTTLYNWNFDASAWQGFVRFASASTSWSFSLGSNGPCDTWVAERTATGRTVTTPAGSFSDTRTISFAPKGGPTVRCAASELADITFAANVGPVAFTKGGVTYTLKSALVAGKRYPSSTPVEVKVKGFVRTDALTYNNKPNSIRCITTPCPSNERAALVNVTYTVTNHGTSPVTYQFSSGCQFNLELLNSSGRVLQSASALRDCAQGLTSFTLQPGRSKDFFDSMEVRGSNGELINEPGTYSIRATLTPRTAAPELKATTSFRLTVGG